jgi:hypothetical protein
MPDYSKSVIYTIRSKDNIYVGSTLIFRSRKNKHKSSLTNENSKEYNYKLYKTIRDNDGEWDMQPHSIFPCNSKLELSIEEERVRRLLNADMNMKSCGTGLVGLTKSDYDKQYHEQNRDERSQYYEQHKDEYNKKRRQKITCECGCDVNNGCLSRHHKSKKHILLMEKLNQ